MLRSTVEELHRSALKHQLAAANSCQLLHSITNARRMNTRRLCTIRSAAELCRWSPFSSQHLTSYHTYGVVQWSRLIWRVIIVLLFVLFLLLATKELKY